VSIGAAVIAVVFAAELAGAATTKYVVTVINPGGGRIGSTDGRIACGPRCSAAYAPGRLVTLQATPSQFFSFAGWDRGCVGTVPTCVVAPYGATHVRALFARLPGNLSVTVGGPGAVVSQPAGISCGATVTVEQCSATFPEGVAVTLIPVPAPGGAFAMWGATCAGAASNELDSCDVVPGADVGASATFRHVTPATGDQKLTVLAPGLPGLVSSPAGIDCPPTCSGLFVSGTAVTLAAGGWAGDCVGISEPCTLIVDGPLAVTAFPPTAQSGPPQDGVNLTVNGPGKVVAGPKIHCSQPTGLNGCMAAFPDGAHVVLRAIPTRGVGRGVRWSGQFCPGRKALTCSVPVYSNVQGQATFIHR
jgi:hypothetical protein